MSHPTSRREQLAAFLRARLDEQEATARHALKSGSRAYLCDGHGEIRQPVEQWADGSDRLPNHHATWTLLYDPAAELRTVAAHRKVLDLLDELEKQAGDADTWWLETEPFLVALASPHIDHTDHPDYVEPWNRNPPVPGPG